MTERAAWWRSLARGDEVWTDYPFAELDEPAGVPAAWKAVTFLEYDGNKYVSVRLSNGAETEVKSGYLHPSRPPEVVCALGEGTG